MIIDYPWYFLLFCLLLGLLYAFLLYRRPARHRQSAWLLFALRTAAVALIAFMLLAPMAKQTVHEKQKPVIVLAEDRSASVSRSADSSFSLRQLEARLSGAFDIVYQPFGTESATDMASAMASAAANREVAVMVLSSDGIYNRGANPTTEAEHVPFPIYTVALGDTTPLRDAAIAHLQYNRIASLGNEFPLEVTVNASHLARRSAVLAISHEGRTVQSRRLDYGSDPFSSTVPFSIPADKPGLQRYEVSLSVVEGEAIVENNTQAFFIDVIDDRQKVVLLANAPHPDLSALKQAIESNPNYEAQVVLADDAGKPDMSKADFSLAVLHNLPSAAHPTLKLADDLPRIYVLGAQTDLPRFNALRTGLEVVSKTAGKTNEVTALHQPSFSLFSLDEPTAQALEQLPPLSAPAGLMHLTPSCQPLFTARLASIDTRRPLISASSQGARRQAFICGEGLWRWRLADYEAHGSHEAFDRLVSQLVAFTAMRTQRDQLRVETERLYLRGEPIVVRAQLYNDAYELVNTSDIKLVLEGDSLPRPLEYPFSREGNAYRLVVPDLAEGIYRYTATTLYDGRTLTATGSFAVEAVDLERRNMVANHALLATVSHLTGGETMRRADAADDEALFSALAAQLDTIKPTIYTHTRYAELLRLPWVLAVLLLLLAAEWAIRKYRIGL